MFLFCSEMFYIREETRQSVLWVFFRRRYHHHRHRHYLSFTLLPCYVAARSRKAVEIGVKNMQAWNDEQVPVYDCLEKLRGYKYLMLIDMDEFLIPRQSRSLMELFVSNSEFGTFCYLTPLTFITIAYLNERFVLSCWF